MYTKPIVRLVEERKSKQGRELASLVDLSLAEIHWKYTEKENVMIFKDSTIH